jgi:DNA-binding transcriptional regulator YiaG
MRGCLRGIIRRLSCVHHTRRASTLTPPPHSSVVFEKLVVDHATFANALRTWREKNHYSQRDAAEVLRVSKRSLENWEQERAMPQGFGLRAMLEIIQVKRKNRQS